MPWSLYPRSPMNTRQGALKSSTDPSGEKKNLLTLPRIKSQFLGHPVCSIITIPTTLSHFQVTLRSQPKCLLDSQQYKQGMWGPHCYSLTTSLEVLQMFPFPGLLIYCLIHCWPFSFGESCHSSGSQWLPTTKANIWTHISPCEISYAEGGTGRVFLRTLWFSHQYHSTNAPYKSSPLSR